MVTTAEPPRPQVPSSPRPSSFPEEKWLQQQRHWKKLLWKLMGLGPKAVKCCSVSFARDG